MFLSVHCLSVGERTEHTSVRNMQSSLKGSSRLASRIFLMTRTLFGGVFHVSLWLAGSWMCLNTETQRQIHQTRTYKIKRIKQKKKKRERDKTRRGQTVRVKFCWIIKFPYCLGTMSKQRNCEKQKQSQSQGHTVKKSESSTVPLATLLVQVFHTC